jgi:hypothetical protein
MMERDNLVRGDGICFLAFHAASIFVEVSNIAYVLEEGQMDLT